MCKLEDDLRDPGAVFVAAIQELWHGPEGMSHIRQDGPHGPLPGIEQILYLRLINHFLNSLFHLTVLLSRLHLKYQISIPRVRSWESSGIESRSQQCKLTLHKNSKLRTLHFFCLQSL